MYSELFGLDKQKLITKFVKIVITRSTLYGVDINQLKKAVLVDDNLERNS